MAASGEALIKSEFLIEHVKGPAENDRIPDTPFLVTSSEEKSGDEPAEKKLKTEENAQERRDDRKERRRERKGQNKNRPGPTKFANETKLCPSLIDGKIEGADCTFRNCPFMHDIDEFLRTRENTIDKPCSNFVQFGKCASGLRCLFAKSHLDENNRNVVNEQLWSEMKPVFDKYHSQLLPRDVQAMLRKRTYDFSKTEKICSSLHSDQSGLKNGASSKPAGPFTDEDKVSPRAGEIKKLDWTDKLYLSPLTTVGNLPFRRLCVDYGADITCSEMSLATSVLQGNHHEYALHRRHPSEKCWGIQLCASSGVVAAKAAQVLHDIGIDYDFIDLNMGCPLDAIYAQGAGSGLMCRKNKFQSMVKSMTAVLGSFGKPFTVKMRTGVKIDKYFAHELIPYVRDAGVSLMTLHGRTRDQRYTRLADWKYIGECVKVASPMPLYGNGDILSWEDYLEKKSSGVAGVMIGRGALIKPWIFQEIKESRHIDMTSSERLELIQRYCNYGLDHWGSDSQGVETTRKFLLEWMSFYHRYIPHGILVNPPQRIQERPPKYAGRDEMETTLASANARDWIKLSEMFLGKVPESFVFVPKHKANSWG